MRLYEFLPVYAHRLIHPVHNDDVSDGVIAACSSRVEFSLVHLCGQYASVGELFEKCAQSIGEELSRRKSTLVDKLFIRAWSRFMKSRRLTDTITYLTSGRGRRIHRAYSVKELKRDLGFEAQVALTEGIHSTVQWGLRNGMLN
jgi:nucleoside-diphosphate-sugar epimerase